MASELGESTRAEAYSEIPSCSANNCNSNDAVDFECNICFDLAQDPIVTLCGHLFCWPCLYKWLHHHSHSQECPVCKALLQEDKLVPLYGRGKPQTDPRSKEYPEIEIPQRPMGLRPETAHPPHSGPNSFGSVGFAFVPVGNFALSAAFAGFVPSLFNVQFHPIHDATALYGTAFGNPVENASSFSQPNGQEQRREDDVLKNLLLLIGVLVILSVILGW